jgi:hypothetical protein
MRRKRSVQELELSAVAAAPQKAAASGAMSGEVIAMLVRRGLRPERSVGDVPFPQPFDSESADRLSGWLGHYGFRLFLRGAIQKSSGFLPEDTNRYLSKTQSRGYTEAMVTLGLAEKISRVRYKLKWEARSFGGTLEWYVGRELERRFGFSVATGIKLHTRGVGGDLDIVAAAEGKLIYLEMKSSPPKNLDSRETKAFCDRLRLLHPDVSLFVVDTALRLSDKVLPMLVAELIHSGYDCAPKRTAGQLWALTPHIYAVNGSRDLMANIGKAIAAGLLALSP